jgi:hypothetical protein
VVVKLKRLVHVGVGIVHFDVHHSNIA